MAAAPPRKLTAWTGASFDCGLTVAVAPGPDAPPLPPLPPLERVGLAPLVPLPPVG